MLENSGLSLFVFEVNDLIYHEQITNQRQNNPKITIE